MTSNVVFEDGYLDIAIIELGKDQEYPTKLAVSRKTFTESSFTFVGHTNGKPKQLNPVEGFVEIDDEQIRSAMDWSQNYAGH